MEHHFTGPSYTIGIEEELMICDARSFDLVNAIESLLEDAPEGEIKPELMESVLEIATKPCRDTQEAGDQLRALRRQVRANAEKHGLTVRAAEIVLISNGPSKVACDAAARAFKEAVSMLSRSLQRD